MFVMVAVYCSASIDPIKDSEQPGQMSVEGSKHLKKLVDQHKQQVAEVTNKMKSAIQRHTNIVKNSVKKIVDRFKQIRENLATQARMHNDF